MPSDNVRRIFNSREAPKPALKRNPPARARPAEPGVNWGQIVATTAVTALVSVAVIGFYQLVTGKVKDKLTPTPPPPTPEPAAALPKEPGRMPKDQETQWVGGMIAPMQGMQNPPPGANPGYAQPQQPQAYPQQYAMMPGMPGAGMQPTAMFPGAPLMLGPGMQPMQMQPMQMQQVPQAPAPSPTISVSTPPHLDRGESEAPEWFVGFAKKNDRRMAKLEAALITEDEEF